MRMKPKPISLLLAGALVAASAFYAALYSYSKSYEKRRSSLLESKGELLEKAFVAYHQDALKIMREVLLAEQVVSALQSKSGNQLLQLEFLLQAIRAKSALPGLEICVLDQEGNFLAGSTRLQSVDPQIVTLGLYGEQRLFARSGGSFFDALYWEGIAPLLKGGKVSGLVHLELPIGEELIGRLRAATGDEIFLLARSEFEGSSLIRSADSQARQTYLDLFQREEVQSQLQASYLDLAGDRGKHKDWILTPQASGVILPLRGMGAEVVATLVALIPERGFLAYRDFALRAALALIAALAALWVFRLLVWAALRISRLSLRSVGVIFLVTFVLFGITLAANQMFETALWRKLQGQNAAVVGDLEKVYRDYQNYLAESVGEERLAMSRRFLRYLKGEPVEKPARYEFVEVPLGLREKSPLQTRVTASHVPVRWSGAGVFSEKAGEPFSREKEGYKVPVDRFAQKIWLVYSSAWGYLNKFGSPYGTPIGGVKIVFQNGNVLALELQNGVNVHDRFSPPKTNQALEFISEQDPLHRMQYVEELEFTVPALYADSKIQYLVFEDYETPDMPIFYGATLGVKKVPALPARLETLKEKENEIQLKEPFVQRFAKSYFVYYEGDRGVEANFSELEQGWLDQLRAPEAAVQEALLNRRAYQEETTLLGRQGWVTYWPIREKTVEKSVGMIAVLTPAAYYGPLRQAVGFIQAGFWVFLLILGVIWLGNVIVSWRRLRFKLISYSFVVTCVPLLLVVSLAAVVMRSREEGMTRRELTRSVEQAEVFLAEVKSRVEDISLRLCSNELLSGAVQENERRQIEKILSEMKIASLADFPASFAVVKKLNDAGVLEEWGTANYNSMPEGAKKLLQETGGGLFVSHLASAILGVNQMVLPQGGGRGAGGHLTVTVGVPLDAYFLAEMKRRVGADILLFAEDTLRLSTIHLAGMKLLGNLDQLASRQFSALLRNGKNSFAQKGSGAKKAALLFYPLKDSTHHLAGMLGLSVLRDRSILIGLPVKKVLVLAALFILALAGLMSMMISRSITSPLAALADGAREISRGALGMRIGVEARDEIGELARSFNQMSESLKDNRDHLEQKIADLLTLQKLSTKVSSVLEKEELMHLVIKLFGELSGFEKGMLLIKDPENHRFVVQSGLGIRRSDFGNLSFSAEETMAGAAVKERKMIYVENHIADSRVPHHSVHRRGSEKPLRIVALPLLAKGNEIGAVVLEHPLEKETPVRVEEVLLMTLANHAAAALENARLYEMAVEDGLTKVFVNRYFQFRLAEEVEHVKRYKSHLSLVLVDLDHFKSINDTYGHQVGDKILIATAQMMKKTFRSSDVVCRYGGDEFAIILPRTGGEEAVPIAERLRHEVEKLDFPIDHKIVLRVTLSVGISSWQPPMDREALIKAADHALYAAKTGGRNRVSRHSQSA